MKKRLLAAVLSALAALMPKPASAQQPALLITRINPQPPAPQSNNEYVELLATRAINFATEPFTVIVCQISSGTSVTNGWVTGGTATYAIEINSGTLSAGELLYVGGNSFALSGTACKTFRVNTDNNSSTGIGIGATGGVFGDGGGQQDGVGVFAGAAAGITSTTTPVDALFYGSAGSWGSQVLNKFKMPVSDLYAGGNSGTANNNFLGPNPGNTNYLMTATAGIFYTNTSTFGQARAFTGGNGTPNCGYTPGVTLAVQNTLSLAANSLSTTSKIGLPNISGVIGDPGDPAADSGFVLNIQDNGSPIPVADYTLTASSSNTTVLPNAGISILKSDGAARVKVNPAAVGYSTITLTLTKGGNTKSVGVNYAASAASATPATTVFHTGFSDGSGAIALDSAYMLVIDDENNKLNVYRRWESGLPVATYDYSGISGLNLSDMSGGVPREIDLEGIERSLAVPNRVYFIGSYSNQSTGSFNARPNRNRIFAMNVTGTGASAGFSYTGDYETMKTDLINWGTANNLGLAASSAANKDPKAIDGFNIEGLAFAPDSSTLYVAFRAPLEPATTRANALIAPIRNFESYFGNGSPSGSPVIGAPIMLDLGGRGFRDLLRVGPNLYVILAGDYGESTPPVASAVYTWNGNPASAPVLISGFDVSGMNPEGALPVYRNGVLQPNQLQLISDNGAAVFYGDGIAAKDLTVNSFKKFRSDLVTSAGTPLPVVFERFDASYGGGDLIALQWSGDAASLIRFEVERSTNGVDFKPAGTVYPLREQGEYRFEDRVSGSPVWFYRLRAVTGSGEAYLTNIRMVRVPVDKTGIRMRAGYATGTYELELPLDGLKQITIRNAAGQPVAACKTADRQYRVSLQSQPDGVYMLDLKTEAGPASFKLIK